MDKLKMLKGETEFATETESDPVNQMNIFQGYLNVLGDSQSKDENKLKAAQELNESFDVILAHSQYQTFLDRAIRIFIKFLQEGTPHIRAELGHGIFITEALHIQQARKLVLEMIQRLPANDLLKPHAKSILSLTIKLLSSRFENRENMLVCVKIFQKLNKHFPHLYTPEKEDKNNQQFQHWKTELQKHLDKPLVKGDVCFLVNSNWFRPMKQYVGLQHPVIPRDRDDAHDENVKPGPINNLCIFKDGGSGIRDNMIDNFDLS